MSVVLDRLEAWRTSNTLVLTPDDAPPELRRLTYALEQAMLPFGHGHGHDQEHKVYQPHSTLARDYRSPVPEAGSQPEFFLRADRFSLYESYKGQYRVIEEWPLDRPS